MSYSMSYTWNDVTCNVGICKSKSTLRDTSYHIRRMTGWALSYCGMRVAGCALYHKGVLHCDVTPHYAVTSLRVTLWRDFPPERHPAIRHIHVNNIQHGTTMKSLYSSNKCTIYMTVTYCTVPSGTSFFEPNVWDRAGLHFQVSPVT